MRPIRDAFVENSTRRAVVTNRHQPRDRFVSLSSSPRSPWSLGAPSGSQLVRNWLRQRGADTARVRDSCAGRSHCGCPCAATPTPPPEEFVGSMRSALMQVDVQTASPPAIAPACSSVVVPGRASRSEPPAPEPPASYPFPLPGRLAPTAPPSALQRPTPPPNPRRPRPDPRPPTTFQPRHANTPFCKGVRRMDPSCLAGAEAYV